MIEISIEIDISRALAKLTHAEKMAVPAARRYTETGVAFKARKKVKNAIKREFDRPTPYTQRSAWASKATGKTPAVVFLKNWEANSLYAQVYGGHRRAKKSERWLQREGLLKRDGAWVPAAGARQDRYGNVPGGQITQILSALGAHPDRLARTTKASKRRNKKMTAWSKSEDRYFAATGGTTRIGQSKGGHNISARLHPGVWERYGATRRKRIRPVMLFVDQPRYRPRLQFHALVSRTVRRNYARDFRAALAMEIAKWRDRG